MQRSRIALAPLLLAAPAIAQDEVAERYRLPPLEEQCSYGPQDADAVVCGRRTQRGIYRIIPRVGDPERVVEQGWGARVSQQMDIARWGDQMVGPFGYRQRSAQRNAEWREERRQIRARENYRGE